MTYLRLPIYATRSTSLRGGGSLRVVRDDTVTSHRLQIVYTTVTYSVLSVSVRVDLCVQVM
jgi:hypothetical protein